MSRRRPLGLMGTFALWSAVVVGVFTIVVTVVATQQVTVLTVEASARSLSGAVSASIIHAMGGPSLDALSQQDVAALDEVMEDIVGRGEVVGIKIWDTDSRVVYSSFDEREVGTVYEGYGNVAKALRGEFAYSVETDKEESRSAAEQVGTVVEVYSPIVEEGSGEVFGVFEVYQDYSVLQARMARRLAWVWSLSAVAGVLLYVAQLMVIQYAAERLRDTENEVMAVDKRLQRSLKDLEDHSMGTLMSLVSAVDAKDSYTARHSLGVTEYGIAAARRLGLRGQDVALLERAGLLHDVGKIGVPEAVLLKPGRLTEDEYGTVKTHSEMSGKIIESIPFLKDLVPVVRHHHERWDGKGYPDGLAGEDIPMPARILMVADAFEAMTADRPYREGMPVNRAREELERCSGTQFDPACVAALLAALDAGEVGPDEVDQETE